MSNLLTQPDENNRCCWCGSKDYDHIKEDGYCSDCKKDVEEKQ